MTFWLVVSVIASLAALMMMVGHTAYTWDSASPDEATMHVIITVIIAGELINVSGLLLYYVMNVAPIVLGR